MFVVNCMVLTDPQVLVDAVIPEFAAVESHLFGRTHNTRRPHQGIGDRIPRAAYLAIPES
jgi:hypothetical protein